MLIPEKITDFFRMAGPLLICGESLASGKIFSQDDKKKKKKKKKNIKIKFELKNFQSSPDYLKRIYDRIFYKSQNTFCIS